MKKERRKLTRLKCTLSTNMKRRKLPNAPSYTFMKEETLASQKPITKKLQM
jgi:hypothetical protein